MTTLKVGRNTANGAKSVIFQEEQICIHCLNTGFAFCVIVGRKRFGILVHLEKQAGFHLITTILAIAKK